LVGGFGFFIKLMVLASTVENILTFFWQRFGSNLVWQFFCLEYQCVLLFELCLQNFGLQRFYERVFGFNFFDGGSSFRTAKRSFLLLLAGK
jgi:hypothetical protein